MSDRDPVLIEQKKKKYKAMQAAGAFCFALSAVTGIYVSPSLGLIILAVSFVVGGLGTFLAWWHHG